MAYIAGLSVHLPGETEKNHNKPVYRYLRVLFTYSARKTPKKHENLETGTYTNLRVQSLARRKKSDNTAQCHAE